MDTIYINGTDIATLGGAALQEWRVGGTALKNQTFLGRWRTNPLVLSSVPTTKKLTFSIAYEAQDAYTATLNKSRVDALLVGKVTLYMPNTLYYTGYTTGIGDLVLMGNDTEGVIGIAQYSFEGICHGPLVTVNAGTVNCLSTAPRTDCILTKTMTAAADAFALGPVTFTNVSAGDVLKVDGIEGTIMVNGAPVSNPISFSEFPYLVPGQNTTNADSISYYPTYI